MRYQFDSHGHPMTEGEVVVDNGNEDFEECRLSLNINGTDTTIIEISPDQWGTWYTINGITIAQEFDTRSFIDAMIKGLTEIRCNFESTIDATIIPFDERKDDTV